MRQDNVKKDVYKISRMTKINIKVDILDQHKGGHQPIHPQSVAMGL